MQAPMAGIGRLGGSSRPPKRQIASMICASDATMKAPPPLDLSSYRIYNNRSKQDQNIRGPQTVSCAPRLLMRDVLAGLAVAGLLLPSGIAYAAIAGLPPASALIATVV